MKQGKATAVRLARELDACHARDVNGVGEGCGGSAGQWDYAAEMLVYLALDREISKSPVEGMRVRDVLEVQTKMRACACGFSFGRRVAP